MKSLPSGVQSEIIRLELTDEPIQRFSASGLERFTLMPGADGRELLSATRGKVMFQWAPTAPVKIKSFDGEVLTLELKQDPRLKAARLIMRLEAHLINVAASQKRLESKLDQLIARLGPASDQEGSEKNG